jgi:hypothetical protein
MTDHTERAYERAFLATATAWRANPARRDEELAGPARRLIYRCLRRTYYDEAAQCIRLMPAPEFSAFSKKQIYRIILQEILCYDTTTFEIRWGHNGTWEDEHLLRGRGTLRCRPRNRR